MKNQVRFSDRFSKFGDLLMIHANKIEIPLFLFVSVSVLLTYLKVIDLKFIIFFTLVPLSIMYYFMAFSLVGLGEHPSSYSKFFRKLLYLTLSICTLALLFYLLRFNNMGTMRQVAPTTIAICLVSYFFLRIRSHQEILLSGVEFRRLLLFIALVIMMAVDILGLYEPTGVY